MSESEDMPLDCDDIAMLDEEAFILGEPDKGCEETAIVLDGLFSSKGIGLVVVRLLRCSRMIRMDRTRLSWMTSFHSCRSLWNSKTREISCQTEGQGTLAAHVSRRR